MSRTIRKRPHWGSFKYDRDTSSCWCCSPKRQRLSLAKEKRMKHSDACRAQSERDF